MPLAGEAHAPAFATSPAPAYAGAYTPAGALGAPAYMGGYAPAAGPAFVGDVAPVRYGGFWRRLWAFVVDSILVWFLTALVQLAMRVNVLMPDYSAWPDRIALLFGIVISWLYAALFMSSRWQGTLAQQVLDLRVTDLSGRRISFLRATARHFAEYGSALLLCLGYAPILFHERRQALHDLIAGTLVVRGGQDS